MKDMSENKFSGQRDSRLDYSIAIKNLDTFSSLGETDLPGWINRSFLNHSPFFLTADDFANFRDFAAELLEVEFHDIWCTGSGSLGFSLNPNKISKEGAPRLFGTGSDIDMAIISELKFEAAWRDMQRKYRHTRRGLEVGAKRDYEMTRNRIFDGCFRADLLLSSPTLGEDWGGVANKLSARASELINRNITAKFWIFRDMWSLRNYLQEGATAMLIKVKK